MTSSGLVDLPIEILALILDHLPPPDFLSLCSSCRKFHDDLELQFLPSYWRSRAQTTFRVPNQPVVESDGRRWMGLYRRLLNQTEIYFWGNNERGGFRSLSHAPCRNCGISHGVLTSSWPTRLTAHDSFGIVADVQCGGASTTVMNSKGVLFVKGQINAVTRIRTLQDDGQPRQLRFPPGYPNEYNSYHEPSTRIKQFSAGRFHVLGLSDNGRIWSWSDSHLHGVHVKFLEFSLVEGTEAGRAQIRFGSVRQVKAGWSRSSAYITGIGIVVWNPIGYTNITEAAEFDAMLILDNWTIPRTSCSPLSRSFGAEDNEGSKSIGEVAQWILLEHFVLFITDLGNIFACLIPAQNVQAAQDEAHHQPMQLEIENTVSVSDGHEATSQQVIDVQGSFRSFAVFFRNGTILIGSQLDLELLHGQYMQSSSTPAVTKLKKLPCLQNARVISMAFGDWHYHALHADGSITSYGREPQKSGALGLGGDGIEVIRGVKVEPNGDGLLPDQCYTTGRKVYFEEEKELWLDNIQRRQGEVDQRDRGMNETDRNMNLEVSERVEQYLMDWERLSLGHSDLEQDAGLNGSADDGDGLATYFALSVAAAGWHSAALVLVNHERAQKRRKRFMIPQISATSVSQDQSEQHPYQPNGIITTAAGYLNSDGCEMPRLSEIRKWTRPTPEWKTIGEVGLRASERRH